MRPPATWPANPPAGALARLSRAGFALSGAASPHRPLSASPRPRFSASPCRHSGGPTMPLFFVIEFWRILTVVCKYVILGVEG